MSYVTKHAQYKESYSMKEVMSHFQHHPVLSKSYKESFVLRFDKALKEKYGIHSNEALLMGHFSNGKPLATKLVKCEKIDDELLQSLSSANNYKIKVLK